NPLVRGLGRVWIPRGLAVAIVYLSFAAAVGLAVVAVATVVVNQTRNSADRIDSYFTVEHGQSRQTHAERDLDRLQVWLDHHHLKQVKVRKQGRDFLNNIGTKDVQKYTSKAISWADGAALRVRARRASALGALGRDPLPRHPPGRGSHRGAERDGDRAPAAPVARHLRPPRGRRDLRPAGRLRRAAAARRRACLLGVLLG